MVVLFLFLYSWLFILPSFAMEGLFCGYIEKSKLDFCAAPNDGRIRRNTLTQNPLLLGEQNAEKDTFKWMAFYTTGKGYKCGGVLISESAVLTAAHCLKNNTELSVVEYVSLGVYDLHDVDGPSLEFPVEKIVIHEDYNRKGIMDRDVGIIFLRGRVQWNLFPNIRPICLPPMGSSYQHTTATLTGWGLVNRTQDTNILQQGEVKVFEEHECANWYGSDWDPEVMICAGSALGSACRVTHMTPTHSGGPLIARRPNQLQHELIGMFTVAHLGKHDNCSTSLKKLQDYSTVYTKIADDRMLDWIQDKMHRTPIPLTTGCNRDEDCRKESRPKCLLESSRLCGCGNDGDCDSPHLPKCSDSVCVPTSGVLLMGGHVNGSPSGNGELIGDCDAAVEDLPEALYDAAAAIKDGSVFHCGGITESGYSNHCYIRGESGVWTQGPSMNTARERFTLNSVGSKLVAIGGWSYVDQLDTVEVLESSVWKVAGFKINPKRRSHCAVTISDSSVLLVGGWDGWNRLKTTEELNIDSGAVTPYADLPYGIWGHACSLYTGQILVSGGFGEGDRRSVYSLDYRSKGSDWVLLNHMEYGRYWHTMHIVNGVLTVYGGVGDGESTLEELVDSSWDAKPMKNRRRQQSSVVLC